MDPMAEARALQSSFRASGSHRGENSPGGRGAPRRRGGGGGSGGGRGGHGGGRGDHGGGRGGGRGGGGRGGYHNVAPNSGLPPSRSKSSLFIFNYYCCAIANFLKDPSRVPCPDLLLVCLPQLTSEDHVNPRLLAQPRLVPGSLILRCLLLIQRSLRS